MLANISPAASAASKSSPRTSASPSRSPTTSSTWSANPEDLGKDVGRLTFVKLAGVEGAKKLSDELVETSLSSVSNLGPSAAPLRELATLVRDRTR